MWALGAFFDLGPSPPRATTRRQRPPGAPHLGSEPTHPRQQWLHSRRGALSAPGGLDVSHCQAPARLTRGRGTACVSDDGDGRTVALDQHTGQPVGISERLAVELHPRGGWRYGDFGHSPRPHHRPAPTHWRTTLDNRLRHPISASPVVVHGTVYIGAADKKLYALDVMTGRQRWTFATQDWIVSAVAYANERVIVASQDSRLHVVGAETGRQRLIYETGRPARGGRSGHSWRPPTSAPWEHACGPSIGAPPPTPWSGRCCSGRATCTCGDFWRNRQCRKAAYGRDASGAMSDTPAIAHNTVYVATAQKQVVALDAATGAERWRTNLGLAITAAPTVAATTVLVGTIDGIVFGLEAHSWRGAVGVQNRRQDQRQPYRGRRDALRGLGGRHALRLTRAE